MRPSPSSSPSSSPSTSARSGSAHPGRLVAVLGLLLLVCTLGVPAQAVPTAGATETADVRPGSGVWPLQPRPRVVHGFDPPATRYGSGHRGVDLAGHPGQVVHASLAGRVAFAGRLAGRGVVVVDHGGTRTTYEPVLATVHVGDPVVTGAVIGRLQLVGSHCFPSWCLHWGLIQGRDTYLDPLVLVGAVPVVLLPSAGSPLGAAWPPAALRDRPPHRASAAMAVALGRAHGTAPDREPALLVPQRSRTRGALVWPLP